MKTRLLLFLLVSFPAFSLLSAQADSALTEIKHHYTDHEMIAKGRDLMAVKLRENDLATCFQIEQYLIANYEEDYPRTIGWRERIWLAFLRNDFAFLLDDAGLRNLITSSPYSDRSPLSDPYNRELATKISHEKTNIQMRIMASYFSQKEKDFLTILLKESFWQNSERYILPDIPSGTPHEDINRFLETYPEQDVLTAFVQEFLAPSFIEKSRNEQLKAHGKERRRNMYGTQVTQQGFGLGIVLEAGGMFSNKNLAHYITAAPILNIGIEGSYSNLFLMLRCGIANNSIKKEFTADHIHYPIDNRVRFFSIDLMLGYNIYNHSYFRIIPFAGVSWAEMELSGVRVTGEDHKTTTPFMFNPVAGLNFDFKAVRNLSHFRMPEQEAFLPIRIQYSYHFLPFVETAPELKGGMHQVTVGFGLFNGGCREKGKKRDHSSI